MRKLSLYLVVMAALTLGVFLLVHAGDKKMSMKGQTLEGTLVDLKCYSAGGFLTNDHMNMKGKKLPNCATACATMGLPVGVVDSQNHVHVLAVPAAAYAKWMAKQVRLTGMNGKYADVFLPSSLEVKENGKWVKKELPGTMM